jgi:DNA-binding NarL/FixJ family response regulator
MDVSMPLINGDEATRQIKKHLPNTRVIALSMYGQRGLPGDTVPGRLRHLFLT